MTNAPRPLLTISAEVSAILGTILALIGLGVAIYFGGKSFNDLANNAATQNSGQAQNQSITIGSLVENTTNPVIDPVSPTPTATKDPSVNVAPDRTRPEIVAPGPDLTRLAERSLAEQAYFLGGRWRGPNESCQESRRIRINGNVLEVVSREGNMIFSAPVRSVSGNDVILRNEGVLFSWNGKELQYVIGSNIQEVFYPCG